MPVQFNLIRRRMGYRHTKGDKYEGTEERESARAMLFAMQPALSCNTHNHEVCGTKRIQEKARSQKPLPGRRCVDEVRKHSRNVVWARSADQHATPFNDGKATVHGPVLPARLAVPVLPVSFFACA